MSFRVKFRFDCHFKYCFSSHFCFIVDVLLIIMLCPCLTDIGWSVCVSKSQRSLCVSFYWTDSGSCIYHFFEWSNFTFLHNSQWITLPNQSCLVLYSVQAYYIRLLCDWSFRLNHHVIYFLCLVYFGFDIVLMALFSAAIRRGSGSVSFLKFPFLCHDEDFPSDMLLVSRWKFSYSCFFLFCFLIIFVLLMLVLSELLLVAIISLPLYFLM